MKNDTHDLRVSARTARLTAAQDDEDGPPWRFSGVAVAAGDILHMDDGTRVLMTAEELKKAATSQAEEPLTVDHPSDEDGRPQYPPPTEETVGKVPKAGWLEEAQGVGYEATTHDQDIADGMRGESYEVSVHPQFELGSYRDDVEAYVAKNIEFLDLSVVSKGDSPSNTAQFGPSQALASYTEEHDIGDELSANDSDTGGGRDLLAAVGAKVFELAGFNSTDAPNVDPAELPDDVGASLHADVDPDSTETTAAESAADNGSTQHMDDNTRQQYIQFLTANADFDEESLKAMDDGVLEQTYELAASDAADGGSTGDGGDDDDDGDADGDGDDLTLGEMTPGEAASELGDALKDQGFVTEDNADELLAQAEERKSKAEKVDEIIAQSDDYGEDDREDLMASADPLLEQEHDRLTGSGGVKLPSGAASLTAGAPTEDAGSSDDEDPDEYGTGVAGGD